MVPKAKVGPNRSLTNRQACQVELEAEEAKRQLQQRDARRAKGHSHASGLAAHFKKELPPALQGGGAMKIPVWWVPIAFFASSFGSIILSCSTAFARGDAHGFCVVLSGPA